jgi:hypothetical protein
MVLAHHKPLDKLLYGANIYLWCEEAPYMNSQSEILKTHLDRQIKERKQSVVHCSRDLDVTPVRIYQWLSGEGISPSRVRDWKFNPAYPSWVRVMAREMLSSHDQAS